MFVIDDQIPNQYPTPYYLINDSRFKKYFNNETIRKSSILTVRLTHSIIDEINKNIFFPYQKHNDRTAHILLTNVIGLSVSNFLDRLIRIIYRYENNLPFKINNSLKLSGHIPEDDRAGLVFLFHNHIVQEWLLFKLWNSLKINSSIKFPQKTESIVLNIHQNEYTKLYNKISNLKFLFFNFILKKLEKPKGVVFNLYGLSSIMALRSNLIFYVPSEQKKNKLIDFKDREDVKDELRKITLICYSQLNNFFENKIDNYFHKKALIEAITTWLTYSIPSCYLENFWDNVNTAEQEYNSLQNPEFVVSSSGWYYNKNFKFLASVAKKKKKKLIGMQHGACYGHLESFPLHTALEGTILDTFYSWGWKKWDTDYIIDKRLKNNVKSNYSLLLSSKAKKLKKKRDKKPNNILFVINQLSYNFFYRIDGCNLKPEDVDDSINDTCEIIKAIDRNLKNNEIIYYKLGQKSSAIDNMRKRIGVLSGIKNIKFLHTGNATDYFSGTKLLIVDYLASAFLLALTVDIPSIMYINDTHHQIRKDSQKEFKYLENANVVFRRKEEFISRIPLILNNIDGWWNSTQTKDALSYFKERQCLASSNYEDIWPQEFKKI